MNKRDIFKVQKPLLGNEVLIYNKDESILFQTPYTKYWDNFFGDEYKKYIDASINEKMNLQIHKETERCDW